MLLTIVTALFLNVQDTSKIDTAKYLTEVMIKSVRADKVSPFTETTLSQSQLETNYGGQELPSFLSKTPSTTWYSEGGNYNGYTYMRLRGIDQTRINFTMDGIPLNEPEDQGTYFSNYPDAISSMKSLQIQRGVGMSTNGAASFGGSVNIESPSVNDTAQMQLHTTAGSYGTYRASVELYSGLMNKTSFYIRHSGFGSNGFRDNSKNGGQSGFFKLQVQSKKHLVTITSFIGDVNNGMSYLAASAADLKKNYRTNYLTPNEKDHFTQSLTNIQFTKFVNSSLNYTVAGYYNYLHGGYGVLMQPDTFHFSVLSNFYGLIGNVEYSKNGFKSITGLHVNTYNRSHYMALDPYQGQNIYYNTGYKKEASAFQKFFYTQNNLTFYGDVQYRIVNFSYVQDRSTHLPFKDITWNFLNPKIGATYMLTDAKSVYVSLGRTSREPTRNDMFAGYDNIDTTNYKEVGNFSRVKPETVTDLEIGTKIVGRKVKLDANIYSMYFQNEIAAIGKLSYIGLPLRKNVASSYRRGIELTVTTLISNQITSVTNATFSRNRISQYTTDYDQKTYNNVSPLLTPEIIANQNFNYNFRDKLLFDFGAKYISQSFLDNTNNSNFVTPQSLIFMAGCTYNISRDMSFNVVVNNLTNQKYYMSGYVQDNQSYYFPMATRNFLATFNIRL